MSLTSSPSLDLGSRIAQSKLPCPNCPSSDAYHIWDDGHGYCFSCQIYTSAANHGRDDVVYTYEYLPWRGITADTFRFYDVKTKIDPEGKPICVGFKYPNEAHKVRYIDQKEFRWSETAPKAEPGLFGRDKFGYGSHKYVTITEGEIDACSLYQVLRGPVVSVRSASAALRDCSADLQWLRSFERVYLAFDDDAVGRDATAAVARLFDHGKVHVVRFSPRKDANEWLRLVDGEDQLRNIWWNSKVYLPENILSGFDTFEKILEGEPQQGVPYPFKTLTDMTYGLRTGESVLIKAPEKVGKTSFMHAILHNLLKETDDAIGAIFLEEPAKRLLQSLAGLELRKPCHLPDNDTPMAEVNRALQQVLRRDNRLYVYSYFGSMGGDALLADIRYLVAALSCRWIMLDPISIAFSGASRTVDERRELEYFSTRLEMLIKELDFGLILTSHVNDYGQTRGSHYLTKVADVTLDLHRDTLHPDPNERSSIRISIPFNRFCAKTGFAGKIMFDPITYTYSEVFDGTEQEEILTSTTFPPTTTKAISSKEFLHTVGRGMDLETSLGRNETKATYQASHPSYDNDNTPAWAQGAVA